MLSQYCIWCNSRSTNLVYIHITPQLYDAFSASLLPILNKFLHYYKHFALAFCNCLSLWPRAISFLTSRFTLIGCMLLSIQGCWCSICYMLILQSRSYPALTILSFSWAAKTIISIHSLKPESNLLFLIILYP